MLSLNVLSKSFLILIKFDHLNWILQLKFKFPINRTLQKWASTFSFLVGPVLFGSRRPRPFHDNTNVMYRSEMEIQPQEANVAEVVHDLEICLGLLAKSK